MYLYIVLYLCSKQKQLGEKMSVQISVRVSKEQKEKLVELAKNENKTITQYIVDRCIVEDSYTDTSNVDDASNRVAEVLHEQIEQIRADFETERSFYVSQIEQKDKQIAEMLETNNNQLQLIGALTIKNETLLLETKQSWWKRLFSSKKNKSWSIASRNFGSEDLVLINLKEQKKNAQVFIKRWENRRREENLVNRK